MSYRNTLVIGFGLILATLLLQCQEIHGKEFLIGDEKGWSPYPGISDWPNGNKNFTPGDVLVFKYDNKSTVVWQVDPTFPDYAKNCYNKCDIYLCAWTEYNSGNDRVVVKEGQNYFQSSDYDRYIHGFKFKICAEFDGKRKNCV